MVGQGMAKRKAAKKESREKYAATRARFAKKRKAAKVAQEKALQAQQKVIKALQTQLEVGSGKGAGGNESVRLAEGQTGSMEDRSACVDTPGWRNVKGHSCNSYETKSWCANGEGKKWALGEKWYATLCDACDALLCDACGVVQGCIQSATAAHVASRET